MHFNLQEEPRNGYQIMQELKQRSQGTFGRMTHYSENSAGFTRCEGSLPRYGVVGDYSREVGDASTMQIGKAFSGRPDDQLARQVPSISVSVIGSIKFKTSSLSVV